MNKVIAITGGIGSGKSFALKIIKKLGYKSFSADLTYKQLLKSKRFVIAVSNLLNVEPITVDGKLCLDKNAVSATVFSDKTKLKTLNDFTHPKIMEKMLSQAKKYDGLVFCEVPLLYEGGFENLFDAVFVIMRKDEERFSSASKRDGKTIEQIKSVALNQFNYTNLQENKHTFIIENDQDEKALTEKIKDAINKII
ncbi:MAG: dephospho-CoA kinase [Clostridia bacterium]|nr:dephospho-CoA kinase [Clostridia bacterium]